MSSTPITNHAFRTRVVSLVRQAIEQGATEVPRVPHLTHADTNLFPSNDNYYIPAFASSWIDLLSDNHIIFGVSLQVLKMEIMHACFVGTRHIILPGPSSYYCLHRDSSQVRRAVAQYVGAIKELLDSIQDGSRINIAVQLPVIPNESAPRWASTSLSGILASKAVIEKPGPPATCASKGDAEVQLLESFNSWWIWDQIRSICNYPMRLGLALKLGSRSPSKALMERWLSEPLFFIMLTRACIHCSEPRQDRWRLTEPFETMILRAMRDRALPILVLVDVDDRKDDTSNVIFSEAVLRRLAEINVAPDAVNRHVASVLAVEQRHMGKPISAIEEKMFYFKDYLQSPLQPLAHNLESYTYEVFEADPVKYDLYEQAISQALTDEWSPKAATRKPVSSGSDAVVIAVVGAGRGPLVTRALEASKRTGVPVKVWAVEKNPSACVFLRDRLETIWKDKDVEVVQADMREWKGPVVHKGATSSESTRYGKVDMLVSELLGSFGDNELSPECIDGVQHVLAPHGISVPRSYTSHLTLVGTYRLYSELIARRDSVAFNTPWVVNLGAFVYMCESPTSGKTEFQQAWTFEHPRMLANDSTRDAGVDPYVTVGTKNDHNTRACHLTFNCVYGGVVHGLAGYFESVLYEKTRLQDVTGIDGKSPPVAENDVKISGRGKQNHNDHKETSENGDAKMDEGDKIELSILPDNIEQKSKNMSSWFPILFPLSVSGDITPSYGKIGNSGAKAELTILHRVL